MNAENPYSAGRGQTQAVNTGGEIAIPGHADSYLESLRKGSPVIKFVISYVIAIAIIFVGAVIVGIASAKNQQNADNADTAIGIAMMLAFIPLIFALIYAVKLMYRLNVIMHLDEQVPSMTPTVSTVLCCIPLVNIVGIILFILKIREHYPRVVANNDLHDAPEINGNYLIIALVASFLGIIPFIGVIFSLINLVVGILLLIQFHKALNYFAARV